MDINGRAADLLLFALDAYVGTDSRGKVNLPRGALVHGFTQRDIQILRDQLFAAHEHDEHEEA